MKWVLIFVGIAAFLGSSLVSANSLTERQFRQLEKAQELVAEEKYSEALEETDDAANEWEEGLGLVLILQLRGQTYQMLDETDKALESYRKALDIGVLEGTRRSSLAMVVAQFYLVQERPSDARAVLIPALEAPAGEGLNHAAQAYILVAMSYQTEENWRASLPWIYQAEEFARDIPENWLLMRAAAEFQVADYPAAELTMKRLISRAPDKRNYWIQLAATQQFQEKQREQLATLELAYQRGLLDDSKEEMLMIQLQGAEGMPARAARNLQSRLERSTESHRERDRDSGSDTGKSGHRKGDHDHDRPRRGQRDAHSDEVDLLVAYQRQSRDFSMAAQTMTKHKSGKVDDAIQLAEMDGNCKLAVDIADKHYRRIQGASMLSAGRCALELQRTGDARVWFQRATKDAKSVNVATQWLTYLQQLTDAGLR